MKLDQLAQWRVTIVWSFHATSHMQMAGFSQVILSGSLQDQIAVRRQKIVRRGKVSHGLNSMWRVSIFCIPDTPRVDLPSGANRYGSALRGPRSARFRDRESGVSPCGWLLPRSLTLAVYRIQNLVDPEGMRGVQPI
jgi:hypothetical protein